MGRKKLTRHIIYVLSMVVIVFILDYACPFKKYLGIDCLSCGMTRAYYSLLKFDFESALFYHPLYWFIPPYVWFLIHIDKLSILKNMNKTLKHILIVLGFTLIIYVYIV